MIAQPMTICDLSPFYCHKGGGIRTYHRARIEWFMQQTRHRYVLISPGPSFTISRIAPTVSLVQVYGAQVSRDANRYRLLLDYPAVRATVAQVRPDVLEAHDPWLRPIQPLVAAETSVPRPAHIVLPLGSGYDLHRAPVGPLEMGRERQNSRRMPSVVE